jgi:superfamily II DNA helicase RecQ
VSGARLGSIAHAVRRLADMTSPDRQAQAFRIDEEIEQLTRRRQEIVAGRARLATVEQMQEQLREILVMTRSMPADFRHLRSMVEQRHKTIARHALAQTPKAELVEEYLHDNDLLSRTAEGIAYRGFARMLSSSEEAETIRRDIDQVLTGGFAREHMSPSQREILDSMFSALLTAQLQVEQSYLRWTTSLRRIVTRAAHGRHARLISVAALALEAAAEWVDSNPADLADAWDCGGLPGASSCGNQAARRVLRTHSPGRIQSASGLAAAARDVRFGGRRAARPGGPRA